MALRQLKNLMYPSGVSDRRIIAPACDRGPRTCDNVKLFITEIFGSMTNFLNAVYVEKMQMLSSIESKRKIDV